MPSVRRDASRSVEPVVVPAIERLCVVAPGLLGGSLALACRKARLAHRVVGVARRQETLDEGLSIGAFDEATLELSKGVSGADVVVLAAPVRASISLLTQMSPYLGPASVVTDMGSTKAAICREARRILGPGRFVGGHPMAGSHRSGIQVARADLFQGACYAFVREPETPARSSCVLEEMARGVGAKPLWMTAEDHDRLVARISHLPHLAACALVECADACEISGTRAVELAASGFRDTTRIAAGNPSMWTDICLTNQAAVLECLDEYMDALAHLREKITGEREEDLASWFEQTGAARRRLRDGD